MTRIRAKTVVHREARPDEAMLSDEDLLDRYLSNADPEAHEAFRELVVRHGPMVLAVCRHVLNQDQDAEDAFQATFLVLAQRGATIRDRRVLAGWLHEVAYRIAMPYRARAGRRRALERQGLPMPPEATEPDDQGERAAWNELRPVLHEELDRLPSKYRIPVILSYLEGKTNEEVAALLNWPVGTVKGRLWRARELLRSRLTRRGLALSAAFLLMSLDRGRAFAEDVPSELVERTVRRVLTRTPAPGPKADRSQTDADLDGAGRGIDPARAGIRGRGRLARFGLMVSLMLLFSLSVAIGNSVAVIAGGWTSSARQLGREARGRNAIGAKEFGESASGQPPRRDTRERRPPDPAPTGGSHCP